MTFQRRTALRIIRLIRSLRPGVRIVIGGYDPTLATEVYEDPRLGIDLIVRGEGDLTFRDLVRAIERGTPLAEVAGLSYFDGDAFRHNPDRAVSHLDDIKPPNRAARVLAGLHVSRPSGRRDRDDARLHVRLQLLFDHRDARPQLLPARASIA